MIIGSPAGIGDFSWLWSKLYAVRNQLNAILIADGWPQRTSDYVRLCWSPAERAEPRRTARDDKGNVLYAEGAGYGPFGYQEILVYQNQMGFSAETAINGRGAFTWPDVRAIEGVRVMLEPNRHLELGRPLASWLPDLPTEYHYPLYTSPTDARTAAEILSPIKVMSIVDHKRAWSLHDAPLVGISCASYRGAKDWNTWDADAWSLFLEGIMALGWQPVILGGYWDDLSSTVAARLNLPDLVGRTSTGQMVEVLRRLDAYIGFSSGLGVVRTVLNKPALSLWPDFQKELSTAWPPPDMLSSGRYVAMPYRDPLSDGLPTARRFLERCATEVTHEKQEQAKAWKEEARQKESVQA